MYPTYVVRMFVDEVVSHVLAYSMREQWCAEYMTDAILHIIFEPDFPEERIEIFCCLLKDQLSTRCGWIEKSGCG
jgi:hypothetical protein